MVPDDKKPRTQINLPGEAIDKATAELIDKLAVKTSEGTVALAGDIFGGAFGDAIKQWRQRNLFGSLAKTADFLKERGVSLDSIRDLPMGELYAVFYGASQEDKPEVQELWAGLLTNALDPEKATSADKQFISVLSELSSDEALILDIIQKSFPIERAIVEHRSKAMRLAGDAESGELLKEEASEINSRDDELRKRFDNIESHRSAMAIQVLIQKGLIYYSRNYVGEIRERDHLMPVVNTGGRQDYVIPSELISVINSISDDINMMNNIVYDNKKMRLFDRKDSSSYRNYDLSSLGHAFLEACKKPPMT